MAQKIDSLQDAVRFFTEASREAADAFAAAQKWKAKTEVAKAVMWFWVDCEKDQRKAAKAGSRGASPGNSQPAQNKPEPAVDQSKSRLIATGCIEHVEVSTGTRTKGDKKIPWTRYGIKLDNGEWYTTFDKPNGQKALSAKGTEDVYELYYVISDCGKYNNLESLFAAGAQPEPQAAQENEQNNHQGRDDDIPF